MSRRASRASEAGGGNEHGHGHAASSTADLAAAVDVEVAITAARLHRRISNTATGAVGPTGLVSASKRGALSHQHHHGPPRPAVHIHVSAGENAGWSDVIAADRPPDKAARRCRWPTVRVLTHSRAAAALARALFGAWGGGRMLLTFQLQHASTHTSKKMTINRRAR